MEGEWRGSCTTFVHFLVDGRWEIAGDDDMVMVGSGVVGVELGCGVGVYGGWERRGDDGVGWWSCKGM